MLIKKCVLLDLCNLPLNIEDIHHCILPFLENCIKKSLFLRYMYHNYRVQNRFISTPVSSIALHGESNIV